MQTPERRQRHTQTRIHFPTPTPTHSHTVNAIPRPKIASQQDCHLGRNVITSNSDRWIEVPRHPHAWTFHPNQALPKAFSGIVCPFTVGPAHRK